MTSFTTSPTTGWFSADDCSVDDFAAIVRQQTDLSDYAYADAVEQNVLIYGAAFATASYTPEERAVQAELIRALSRRPRHRGLQGRLR